MTLCVLLSNLPVAAGVDAEDLGLFAVMPFLAMWAIDVTWAMKVDKTRATGTSVRDLRVLSCAIHTLGRLKSIY